MANEAVIIELLGNAGDPIRYTVDNTIGVAKGSLMKLADARLISAHAAAADVPIVGIAASEKVANDGSTTLAVYTNGIFDLTAAAAGVTAVGAICACSATAQMITAADADDLLQGSTVGQCLEAHANDEVAAVRILK
jgi:hypothetical protein